MKTPFLPEPFIPVLFALAVCWLAGVARADVRNFSFHGTVAYVDNPFFFLDASVQENTPIDGYYVFDSATPDSDSNPTVGDYEHTNYPFGMVVKIGNYVFCTDPKAVHFQMEIVDQDTDNYTLWSFNNVCSQPLRLDYINWQLDGGTNALTSDALPYNPPVLTNFDSIFGLGVSGVHECFFIQAHFTSLVENTNVIPQLPPTTNLPAIGVKWPSHMGYFYQVQSSTNLKNWEDVGEPVLGDGSEISEFFSKEPGKQLFYRAAIKNYNDDNSPPTNAAIRNFAVHGTVASVNDFSTNLNSSVSNGAPVEGFYVFDSNTPDSNGNASVGDYQHTNGTFGLMLKIGNYVFRSNPEHVDFLVEIVNGAGGDNYLLRSYNNVCSQPVQVKHISWQLDAGTNALASDALPSNPPVLTNFSSVIGLRIEGIHDSFLIQGNINSVEANPAVIPQLPKCTVGEAIEVKWQSALGYFYQVQSSTNQQDWTSIGEPVLGDGGQTSKFYPKNQGGGIFYRVEIKNFQGN